jgi:hypothetical protein
VKYQYNLHGHILESVNNAKYPEPNETDFIWKIKSHFETILYICNDIKIL